MPDNKDLPPVDDEQMGDDAEDLLLEVQHEMLCASQSPDVREDLVKRVQAQIAAGTYETPERLGVTIRRLIEDIDPRRNTPAA